MATILPVVATDSFADETVIEHLLAQVAVLKPNFSVKRLEANRVASIVTAISGLVGANGITAPNDEESDF